jgi:excisionase family DNA binding protein
MSSRSAAPNHERGATPIALQEREYDNVTQAAARLGVSRVSVWRWIRDGRLPASRLGHRTTRIAREDLERFLQARDDGAPATVTVRVDGAECGDDLFPDPDEHIVRFYESDAALIDAVSDFIGAALAAGDIGIVIATEPHRAGIAEHLQAQGLLATSTESQEQYVALDAAETLAHFLIDGQLDAARLTEVIGGLLAWATGTGRRVRVFGEMVALLAAEGNHAAAIELEQRWNELQQTYSFSLLCAYPLDQLGEETHTALVHDICTTHSRVLPAESYLSLSTEDERLRAIATLQQKAQRLEAEIAERQQAEERLRLALEEAEAALRARDEFLAVAAHELRNPLAGLSLHAQLARRRFGRAGALESAQVEHALSGIAEQAERLSSLVDRLLDVSRLEAGQLALEPQPTDLALLVRQVIGNIQVVRDGHPITLEAPASLLAQVDPMRLAQVLVNLLDNAIKFSPEGSVIDIELTEPKPGTVELSVRDHGRGIPLEARERIFERFSQVHRDDVAQGLGLGLAVSRQVVELHGGQIQVGSPADGGTRVVVTLPNGEEEHAVSHAAD